MNMRHLPIIILALCLTAAPAQAAPIGAAIGAISGAISWVGSTAIGSFLLRTAASFALSALATALSPKAGSGPQRGVETKATTSGGTQPQTLIFGKYATGGNAVTAPMTHGLPGQDVVEYLNYVFDISDFRITDVTAVYVDGERQRFKGGNWFYGRPAVGTRFFGHAWMRWYDGTQTEADPMLTNIYDSYMFPWTSDHKLIGVSYAVLTFKYDEDEFQGFPEVRFEVLGAPLYDPRKDSSVGGNGPQRWDDQDTWEFTENPVVMVYNIMRGIRLADGSIYGLEVPESDLPIGRWVAAMNACDEGVPTPEGIEPRYRAGLEFGIDQEPLAVIGELLKSCGGHVSESGGTWNVSVGPAPFPVASFTDESIIVSDPREFEPFRGLNQTYNGIHASYLNPDQNWQSRDEAPYYRADYEAEDGDRRLIAQLDLPTVTYRRQVQRLMQELLHDNRRMRVHSLTLPPNALGILPLDTITWTSEHNGYQDQLFEVQSKTIDPQTLNVRITIRERDVSDYSYDYTYAPEIPSPGDYNSGIRDGAPEDEDENPPHGDYTDSDTGDPLDPAAPAPGIGELLALHDGAITRSTDAGANWTYLPTPLSGLRDFSAFENGGVVALSTNAAHFTTNFRSWRTLSFEAVAEIDLVLTNGDFEFGDLTGWENVSGTAEVIDTAAPAQQGGQWYLTGQDYAVEQVLDLPASAGEEVVISADAYATADSTATLSVVAYNELPTLTGNQGWSGNTITNYATAPDGSQLDLVITSGGSGLTSSGDGASMLDLQYTNGDSYSGPWMLAFRGLTTIKEIGVENSKYIDVLVPSGSALRVPRSPAIGYTGAEGDTSPGTGNGALLISANPASIYVDTLNSTVSIGPGGDEAFYNSYEYAAVTIGSAETSGSFWQTLKVRGDFAGRDALRLRLEGDGAGAYFDNVRVYTQVVDAETPEAVATDKDGGRHLVATRDGLHEVDAAGTVTALNEIPFQPSILAADGDTVIIADGTDIAISVDNGATWSEHTTGAAVTQLFAAPASVAVLSDGSVVSVSTGGLTTQNTFAVERWLSHSRRAGEWVAVDQAGDVVTGGLVTWLAGTDQPAAAASQERRILSLEAGRRFGWNDGGRDIFYRDFYDAEWSLGYPLLEDIKALKEVR
jgi:hypothetical protein